MDSRYQEGHPPSGPVITGRAFKRILIGSSILTFFLPFTVLAFQPALFAGSDTPECSKQGQFETLVAKGRDSKVPLTARESALEEAVRLCPQDPAAYEDLTRLFLRQKDFQHSLNWVHSGLKAVPGNANLLLELGTILLSAGHPQQALLVFKDLPDNAKTEFYLGMTYRALRDHKQAQQALSKSFAMGNRDPYVLYALIEQDHDLRDTEAGLKDFRTFYQNFPHSAWLHLLLGNAYSARHDVANAEAEYKKAAAINPDLPVVHFSLGLISFTRGDYAAAIQDFHKEIKVDPAFGRAYLYLGTTLRRVGKNSEALPYLKEAVARDPNFALAYSALASSQIEAGQSKEALKTLQEAERRFPQNAAFPARLSQVMRARGDARSAEKQSALAESLSQKDNPVIHGVSPLKDAASKPPESSRLQNAQQYLKQGNVHGASQALSEIKDTDVRKDPQYFNLKAQILNLEKKHKDAIEVIQKAIAADPKKPTYWMTQGRIYQGMGNQEEAIKSFLRAGEMESNPAEAVYYIGLSFFLMGNYYNQHKFYVRAAQHFKTALKLDPHFDKAEFMLGAVNSVEFRLPQAKVNFERALQMNPQNPFYILHYGILLSRMGDTAGALREMKRAEQLNPSYARAYFNLGSLEARIGSYKEAKEQLEAGIKLDPEYKEAYYTLGRVYHRLGMSEKSQEALRKFQELKTQEQTTGEPVGGITAAESSLSPE
jgi:tetratricopeptide (TPR) repeat protein